MAQGMKDRQCRGEAMRKLGVGKELGVRRQRGLEMESFTNISVKSIRVSVMEVGITRTNRKQNEMFNTSHFLFH